MNLSNTYKIGSLISLKKGKKPNNLSSENVQGLMPYVDIKSFETGVIDKYTDGEKCVECKDGDLLIVCDGSRSGLIGKAIEGFVGSTLALIEPDGRIDKNYLYYFIQGKYQLLNKNVKGTGTPHLKQDLLKSFEIAIPSLEIQKQIVQQIEEQLSELDSAVETLKKTKQQLEIYRQAVLKEAFQPLSEYYPITEYFDVSSGLTKNSKRNTLELKMPYLRVANVYYDYLDLSEIKTIGVSENEIQQTLLKKNDLLFVEGNGSKSQIGRVAIWDGSIEKILHQNHIIKGRPNGSMLPNYALYFFMSYYGRNQILKVASSTSGLYTLSANKIRNLQIPYCDLAAQQKIISIIEEKTSVCKNIEQTVNQTLQQAEALRQSILKQAFEKG
ncbi:MAG: restriction endonuclease subunit S [Ruminococcus sp.]|nr:restriction endonuclease subunit S [Ruminococcus sp.]